jgi:hypothetical protein
MLRFLPRRWREAAARLLLASNFGLTVVPGPGNADAPNACETPKAPPKPAALTLTTYELKPNGARYPPRFEYPIAAGVDVSRKQVDDAIARLEKEHNRPFSDPRAPFGLSS